MDKKPEKKTKVTILLGSTRRGGNTDLLAQAFARGAGEHCEVETISVADYKVSPCVGCNYCYANAEHLCCLKDDMAAVYEKLRDTDVLVIASPVYFYGVSAKLKAMIDRLHNPIRKSFGIKKMALLSVGADNLPGLFDAILAQYGLTLDYFHFENLGSVLVRGAEEKGAIKGSPALDEAYALGQSVR